MLDRLAQLIVDKLQPQIDRTIQAHIDELKLEIEDQMDASFNGAVNTFNVHITKSLPKIKNDLKSEVKSEIVRGFKI